MKKVYLISSIISIIMILVTGCVSILDRRITSGIINEDMPVIRFAVSPDQKSVAVCVSTQNTIWNINLANGDREKISAEWGCNKLFAWRPNSQQIFYLQEIPEGTGKGAIVSRDIASNKITTVVAGQVNNFIFSQDGNSIAYQIEKENGSVELWIMDLIDSTSSKITEGNISLISWSPDGKGILYRSYVLNKDYRITGGNLQLYNLDSRKTQQIMVEFTQIANVLYSPNGKWLAVSATKGPEKFLNPLLINSTDFSVKSFREPESHDMYLIAWSPQGNKLLYDTIDKNNEAALRSYDVDQGVDVVIVQGTINDAFWSPDGNKIVYTQENTLFLTSVEGKQTQILAKNIADRNLLPSFQWLSLKEYIYMDVSGLLHLDYLPS